MPPNLVNFGPETVENGWRVFAQCPKIASLTAWTLYNRQQANFSTCYVVARAYSLEQEIAGGLTHGFAMHLLILNFLAPNFVTAVVCVYTTVDFVNVYTTVIVYTFARV